MKKFLLKMAMFLVVFVVLDNAIYYASRYLQAGGSFRTGSLNLVYSGDADVDIAFFGSSRMMLHVNPRVIEQATRCSAYNFGVDGTNFEQHRFTIYEYLLHNRPPKAVVMEADLQSLDERPLDFIKEMFRPYIYESRHTFRLLAEPDGLLQDYLPQRILRTVFRSFPYRNAIPDLLRGYLRPDPLETDGYVIIKGAHLKKGSRSFDPADRKHRRFLISPARERAFDELASDLAHRGITLALLMTPRYKIFDAIDEGDYTKVVDVFTRIAGDHDNVYFLNMGADALFTRKRDIYWNADHLNKVGADRLSREVGSALAEIYSPPGSAPTCGE
jgi:hypothetical protein